MNIIKVATFVLLAALCTAEYTDNPRPICEKKDKWLAKPLPDNRTPNGKAVKPDIDDIYSWNTQMQYLVNVQIRNELHAFYSYLRMSRFFQKYDETRPGFAKFFRDAANEEMEHAEMFMQYQQMRGGDVVMWEIPKPDPVKPDWTNGKDVLVAAYELEKRITDEIHCLHQLAADKFNDVDFLNFLEEKVIPEQYQSMKDIKTHIKNLERACPKDATTKCDAYPLYELQYDIKQLK